tara:strand:+ start:12699 stop:13166 length:468 start_codon:yes stop_codon:yes gene_type:complete
MESYTLGQGILIPVKNLFTLKTYQKLLKRKLKQMPSFGNRSLEALETVDIRISKVLHEAIKHYDFSVLEGHRDEETQNKYVETGASKLKFPYSKHNKYPSLAVDIVPYPVDWENLHRFKELSKVIKDACEVVGVDTLSWGYDLWKWDMPHWELER